MKVLAGIIVGIAAVILLLFGYNEYQKYKVISARKDINNSSPANSDSEDRGISPSDFQIISFNPRWEDGRLRAIGEIKNNGKLPAGPKVEVIARDAKGELIASKSFWPNSINNIPPGGTSGIALTITEDTRAKSADIKVIGVDIWK